MGLGSLCFLHEITMTFFYYDIYFMVRSTCRHLFDYGESEKSIMANKNCLANLKSFFPTSVSVHSIDAAIFVMKQ